MAPLPHFKLTRLCGVLLLASVPAGAGAAAARSAAVPEPQPAVAGPATKIVVLKAERELHLYRQGRPVARYPVGLGFNPTGSKLQEGDGATPEGRYVVCVKNPKSRYYLSLGINYPNSADAALGLAEERISAEEARMIEAAEQQRACPPWHTALGGEIYIHGRGSSEDWTLGCIALDDPDMEQLFEAVSVGTEVEIRP